MSLIVETGAGVAGAEAYASEATATAYWAARSHTGRAAIWAAATAPKREGALREASATLDALYGQFYRGSRAGYLQGLEWPRSAAKDDDGFDLPSLPPQILAATCELAARALSGPLVPDTDVDGAIKRFREKLGPMETETEYQDTARRTPRHGPVDLILGPVLTLTAAQWGFR